MRKFLAKSGELRNGGSPDGARAATVGLFANMSLIPPNPGQFDYPMEYLANMQPISTYLDVLQGEENYYLGCMIHILVKLRTKLRSLDLTKSASMKLRDGLLVCLDYRFGINFYNDLNVISAIVHPRFKLERLYFDMENAESHTLKIEKKS